MDWSSWNPFKPFGRGQAEVERILAQVLAGTVDPREWGDFLDIPMKGTPALEAIRQSCIALADSETFDEEGAIVYTDEARAELQGMLSLLSRST